MRFCRAILRWSLIRHWSYVFLENRVAPSSVSALWSVPYRIVLRCCRKSPPVAEEGGQGEPCASVRHALTAGATSCATRPDGLCDKPCDKLCDTFWRLTLKRQLES